MSHRDSTGDPFDCESGCKLKNDLDQNVNVTIRLIKTGDSVSNVGTTHLIKNNCTADLGGMSIAEDIKYEFEFDDHERNRTLSIE